MKLYLVKLANENKMYVIPMAGKDAAHAEMWAKYVCPEGLFIATISVNLIESASTEKVDYMVEMVEEWWGRWCDYADGNANISERAFNDSKALMHCTFDAIYAVEN